MAAPIIFTIYLSWTVLDVVSARFRFNPLPFAAPIAGLACAAFGFFYYY